MCDLIRDVFTCCVRLRNDLYCVGWGVKLYSLTHFTCCVWSCDMDKINASDKTCLKTRKKDEIWK